MRERGRDIEEAARGRAAWAPFLHSWPGDNQRTEPDPSPSPSCTRGPDPSPSPSPDAPALPESIDEATLEREARYLPHISRVSPAYLPCISRVSPMLGLANPTLNANHLPHPHPHPHPPLTLTLTLTRRMTLRWSQACKPGARGCMISALEPVEMTAVLGSGSAPRPPLPQPRPRAPRLILGSAPSRFEAASQS
jgi:hypothetical protein